MKTLILALTVLVSTAAFAENNGSTSGGDTTSAGWNAGPQTLCQSVTNVYYYVSEGNVETIDWSKGTPLRKGNTSLGFNGNWVSADGKFVASADRLALAVTTADGTEVIACR